ncbi:serine protein kinase PrkA [Desulfobulbus rhabdoformis]|uniref:serine protein kinase PrkA n=1 Tax=Desulfobulbus rhabdoformis TaxID=34032 RepID=UPI001964B628|nr:serine protein kinase PrkA [Desulfobulbus rhabdoformis]MBM9615945.1 serine protein kinase PrkA [Desulfobulbus rhabdoformis]
MGELTKALNTLQQHKGDCFRQAELSFDEFLGEVIKRPERNIRNVIQVYADMIHHYVQDGHDEYSNDPESINYLNYDCSKLFVEGSDRPFFADRLFANRLLRHVESLLVGDQQNKIYIFDGPHGSGKSTFLNNFLRKFEEYANTPEGSRYEVVWRLRAPDLVGGVHSMAGLAGKISQLLSEEVNSEVEGSLTASEGKDHWLTLPCPSHDHPLLLIPKEIRRQFLNELLDNAVFKDQLFNEKKYEWVFRDEPCTICAALYQELLKKSGDPLEVLKSVFARPYRFNRRLGTGISVFNPGDRRSQRNIRTDDTVQRTLNALFAPSGKVPFLYSGYAKVNNGIYALMDVKSHNTERLMDLHNIISDGVHKVDHIEERVNSLFVALMNPEDKKVLTNLAAFSDRIEYINTPYVLDIKTEVEIYREVFGKHIDESFLPRVLHNFARVIIATRLRIKSDAMLEWIQDPEKYEIYCDANLQLLKMEIYTGYIPAWLEEEDVERFNSKRRLKIIAESEQDGWQGLSGRDSIRMFNEFYSMYARDDKLIDMSMLGIFFRKYCKKDKTILPMGFLDSLLRMYNYTVLQSVKESLYYYNEEQISRDIQNYMFAVNFEVGTSEICRFTGQRLEISEAYFERIESRLMVSPYDASSFRASVQRAYTSSTLTQEILRDEVPVTKTALYLQLRERYIHNLKEKVLDPFLDNENFRRAVKEFDQESFKTYDQKIQSDVRFMMKNLQKKFGYTRQGAKEICIYVIDNNLARIFTDQLQIGQFTP